MKPWSNSKWRFLPLSIEDRIKLTQVLNDHGFTVRGWANGRPVMGGTGEIDWVSLQEIVEAFYRGETIPDVAQDKPKRKKKQ